MTTLKELAVMLDAATGPSRGLDRAVGIALAGWTATTDQWGPALLVDGNRYPDTSGSAFPDITSSVDAALSLVGRLLPGCEWELIKAPLGHFEFQVSLSGEYGWEPASPGQSAPLAIIKALVAALIAQENDHG